MLNDCEIDNNFAYGGGAFTGTGVRVELNSCDIHHNDAAVDGAPGTMVALSWHRLAVSS